MRVLFAAMHHTKHSPDLRGIREIEYGTFWMTSQNGTYMVLLKNMAVHPVCKNNYDMKGK